MERDDDGHGADVHPTFGCGPPLDCPATAEVLSDSSAVIGPAREVSISDFGNFLAVDVAARDVEAAWTELRHAVPTTGRWPVVVGRAGLRGVPDHLRLPGGDAVARWLAEAAEVDGPSAIDRLRNHQAAELALLFTADELLEFEASRVEREADADTWPDLELPDRRDLLPRTWFVERHDPATPTTIALIPTRYPWETAAHLGFGGWNENPSPADHVAIHRYWYDLYGAEVTVMAHSVVETRVLRPPTDRASTTRLAFEQYTYDPDFDLTIGWLARKLHRTPWWHFWWD